MKTIVMRMVMPLLLPGGINTAVRADGTPVNCERTNGYYQYFSNATVNVGTNAAVGDLVGTWLTSSNPSAWTCRHRTEYLNLTVPMSVEVDPLYNPAAGMADIKVDGNTHTVYLVPGKAGLGYIARYRFIVKGKTTNKDWFPMTGKTAGKYEKPNVFVNVKDTGSTWNFGIDIQIRFVKTANTLNSGTVGLFDPIYVCHYQSINGVSEGSGTYMIAQYEAGTITINTNPGTCTTPNVTVDLAPVSRSDFTNIGYTAARTDFALNFNKCPAGSSSISYMLSPTTTIVDRTNGVMALASTSTASGVGIQLLTDKDIPITFNSTYLLADYDPERKNANYTVPLRAGLYQTAESVSSGTIKGAATFTISYK